MAAQVMPLFFRDKNADSHTRAPGQSLQNILSGHCIAFWLAEAQSSFVEDTPSHTFVLIDTSPENTLSVPAERRGNQRCHRIRQAAYGWFAPDLSLSRNLFDCHVPDQRNAKNKRRRPGLEYS